MANYHLEVKMISRGSGRSLAASMSYILGEKMRDYYLGKTYRTSRRDVVAKHVYLPENAPPQFRNPQSLCREIDQAEKRWDAQTARQFIGSLPNELPPGEWVRIVRDFVERNFLSQNLCAVAAIHRGRNPISKDRNNPHVHIIVSTRTLGPEGFSTKKDREHNKRKYLELWRQEWALVQNRAYERNHMKTRVSHQRLAERGIERIPTIHLSTRDWQREQRGERTIAGNRKRAIQRQNREIQLERERLPELDRHR